MVAAIADAATIDKSLFMRSSSGRVNAVNYMRGRIFRLKQDLPPKARRAQKIVEIEFNARSITRVGRMPR
jgi:hypothetical protein